MIDNIDIVKDFIRHLRNKELSERTLVLYGQIVQYFITYINDNYNAFFETDTVKGYMVSNWYTSILSLKPTTKSLYLLTVRQFLNFLYSMQYVSFDLSIALPKPQSISKSYKIHPEDIPNKRAYTPEEINAMMNFETRHPATRPRNRAIIAMLVSSGLRAGELSSLNVGDVLNDEDFAMVARKGTHGNKVKVAIPKEALEYVKEHLAYRMSKGETIEDSSPLIANEDGSRTSRANIYNALSFVERKLGIPTGTHTFRHTALTATAKFTDPIVARDLAGQRNISITNRYLHSTDEELIEATEKLSRTFLKPKQTNMVQVNNKEELAKCGIEWDPDFDSEYTWVEQ